MKIVIASTNPVKVRAALNGFRRLFPQDEFETISVNVPSEVAAQPLSDEETLRGALNRSRNAQAAYPEADYWIGIEGGIQPIGLELAAFAWIVIRSADLIGKGRTGTFFLPPAVAELIRQGKELGEADDIVFGRSNSKQDNGAVGLLTDNVIDRAELYEHAMILALISFKNRILYTGEELDGGLHRNTAADDDVVRTVGGRAGSTGNFSGLLPPDDAQHAGGH